MKILVTGGAGFIGSALVRHIIQNTDHIVLNLDLLTYAGNLDSLSSCKNNERYFFEKVDICSGESLKKVLQNFQPEAVMHLAAESHVDRSIDGPAQFMQTNILGTFNLLECVREYYGRLDDEKRSIFRFHHISTDEVYGDLGFTDDLFNEESPYDPSSPYAASKACSDHLVRSWGRTYGIPTLVSNCSNNYGPFHFPEKLIPHVILSALNGKDIPIYGDGSQIRDWLYVEDHAKALMLIIENGVIGETYNIGGNNEVKNIDVVNSICDYLEKKVPAKSNSLENYHDLITFVKDRPGHDLRYAIDSTKIQEHLDWKPLETFETGLRKTIDWYLENKIWWERVLSGDYKLTRLGENNGN